MKKKQLSFLMIALALVMFAGCTNSTTKNNTTTKGKTDTYDSMINDSLKQYEKRTYTNPSYPDSSLEKQPVKSSREYTLENNINKLRGLSDCTVVKNGKTVYVAVENSGAGSESVKKEITAEVKKKYSDVDKVYVSFDKGILTKLKNFAENLTDDTIRGIEDLFR